MIFNSGIYTKYIDYSIVVYYYNMTKGYTHHLLAIAILST